VPAAARGAGVAEAGVGHARGTETILLIEDDDAVRARTNDDVARTGVLHDAVHFVQKPFAPAAIAHKAREILSS
jgi:hypothetical protein